MPGINSGFARAILYAISVPRIIDRRDGLLVVPGWTFDLQRMFGPRGLAAAGDHGTVAWRGVHPLFDFATSSDDALDCPCRGSGRRRPVHRRPVYRLTSVLTAIFFIGYLWRAPLLAGEMEYLLALLLVYLCVGPCGAELSIDKPPCASEDRGRPAQLQAEDVDGRNEHNGND